MSDTPQNPSADHEPVETRVVRRLADDETDLVLAILLFEDEIGRASCRERV